MVWEIYRNFIRIQDLIESRELFWMGQDRVSEYSANKDEEK